MSRRSRWILVSLVLGVPAGVSGQGTASPPAQGQAPANQKPPLKPEQLEAVVAPIALYPDPLLAQVLMASTYPLEIVEAARWSKANPKVQGKDLEDAMQKQSWDASVKSLCSFPDTLAMMNDKLDWTQQLGDAFLAQQQGVMDAVQRLRAKAQAAGNLKSSKEQKVTTEKAAPPPADGGVTVVVQQAPPTVIKIEPANPQVVYVPAYNPTVVYGTWAYPAYPPPPVYPPGYVAATAAISFGVGLAVGAALWGGCSWGYHNTVVINTNNYARYNHVNVNNINVNNVNVNNRVGGGGSTQWQHDPAHRQGVPYRDASTQQRFGQGGGGTQSAASRDAFRGKAEQGRQQIASGGGAQNFRPSGGGSMPGGGGAGTRATPSMPGGGGAGTHATPSMPGGGGAGTHTAGGLGAGGEGTRGGFGGGAPSGGSAFHGVGDAGGTREASVRGRQSVGGGGGFHGGRRR
ncbi:MAG TPA: DUF3300 domain-containing protein [Myxococcaceae bacterium]|jgi:hypothetical protein